MKKIEVILPCFNEELNIPIVHDKILEATAGSIHNFNITFIDDGSTDKTWEVINHLCKKIKQLTELDYQETLDIKQQLRQV